MNFALFRDELYHVGHFVRDMSYFRKKQTERRELFDWNLLVRIAEYTPVMPLPKPRVVFPCYSPSATNWLINVKEQ